MSDAIRWPVIILCAIVLIGLIAYVGLGVLALRPGRPRGVRATAWVAALLTAGWIVSVAITKSPLGFLGYLLRLSS